MGRGAGVSACPCTNYCYPKLKILTNLGTYVPTYYMYLAATQSYSLAVGT